MIEEIATELIISAAQLGHGDVIQTLYVKGADIEEKDLRRGGRPLMHAANNGHAAAVKALIECGVDLDARDDNGYTALMVAIFSDRSSCADLLLKSGAEVSNLLFRICIRHPCCLHVHEPLSHRSPTDVS